MSSKPLALYIPFIFFLLLVNCRAQNVKVNLDTLTSLDKTGIHITPISNRPEKGVKLPADTAGAKYFTLFYSWEVKGDHQIAVMVQQKEKYDLLWIDKNNDEDLTNDGTPLKFNLEDNFISFDIAPDHDPAQKTRLSLERLPSVDPKFREHYVDKEGNLAPPFLKQLRIYYDNFASDGSKRTFYFDGRITTRRGRGKFNGKDFLIGLFDYSNNGIFNDSDDVVIIDKNEDNCITFGNMSAGSDEIVKLDEIFSLNNKNYKIVSADRYGKWIEFAPTNEEPNFSYLKHVEKIAGEAKLQVNDYSLDVKFWESLFTSIDGKAVKPADYKGKYLLLNFWGEWCKPCIKEINDMVKIFSSYPRDKFEIIGFINTSKPALVKKIIKEKGMKWNNIIAPPELLEHFRIKAYPTNILIYPDGKAEVLNGAVSEDYFIKNIK